MSSLSCIKRLARGWQPVSGELKGLLLLPKPAKHAIDEQYVVVPKQKRKQTPEQKRNRIRKISRQSHTYNLRKVK